MTGEISLENIDKKCMEKALNDSLELSKYIMDHKKYPRLYEFITHYKEYYEKYGFLPSGYGDELIEIIQEIALKMRPFIEISELVSFLPPNYIEYNKKYYQSTKNIPDILKEILFKIKNEPGKNEIFMLYYYLEKLNDKIEIEIKERCTKEEKRKLNNIPSEYIHLLLVKDEFNRFYENIFRKRYFVVENLIKRYPGISEDQAYIFCERLFSVSTFYPVGDKIKSDVRCIRNALTHDKYSIENGILKLNLELGDKIYSIEMSDFPIRQFTNIGKYACLLAELSIILITPEILRIISR